MATSLGDLFDGAQTTDAVSDAQAITAGTYVLAVQGTLAGATVSVTGNFFDSTYDPVDGAMDLRSTGFRAFVFCAGNVKATVSNATAGTSVKVGISAAS